MHTTNTSVRLLSDETDHQLFETYDRASSDIKSRELARHDDSIVWNERSECGEIKM